MPTQDKTEEVLARFPGPVTLYPSRKKWFLLLLVCAGFTAGGVWMASEDAAGGWFVTAVFGIFSLTAVITMLPGAGALKLDRDGFELVAMYRSSVVRWQDASAFTVARIPTSDHHLVVFDNAAMTPGKLAKVNVCLVGRNSSLPDTYGLSAVGLTMLMARWRERATAK